MSERGVIYVFWGDKVKAELERSVASLQKWHPELPYQVFQLPESSSLLAKAGMLDLSPYESTLFLDTDTVVLDRLDFGFEKAEQFDLACCICECPWARRYAEFTGDRIEYNTGVLFFTKQAKPVFDQWKTSSETVDSSIRFMRQSQVAVMPRNDQGPFLDAIEQTGFNPFVLPLNWNYRPAWQKTFYGPIKVWHDRNAVPKELLNWNEDQSHEASIIRYSGGD